METFKAGYYSLKGAKGLFNHAFVGVESGSTVWFDCYGGHFSDNRLNYPIITESGNLRFARAMCNLQPNSTKAEYNSRLDACGIIYGVMGVCHQMANRVLYATDHHRTFPRKHDFILTWLVYGYYGNFPGYFIDQLLFKRLREEICKIIGIPDFTDFTWTGWLFLVYNVLEHSNIIIPSQSFEEFVNSTNDKYLKLELSKENPPDLAVSRLNLLLNETDHSPINTSSQNTMSSALNNMMNEKNQQDGKFLDQSLTVDQYCDNVNKLFSDMLTVFKGTVSKDEYNGLFALDTDEVITLVDPNLMKNFLSTN